MKNAIFTLILSLGLLSLQAAPFSNLNLAMADHANYEVVFNNRVIGNTGNNFTLSNLAPGRYSLLVARLFPGHRVFEKRVIFNGLIDIPAGSDVNAVIDRFNRLQLNYSPIPVYSPYGPGHCGTPGGYYTPAPVSMDPVAFGHLINAINNQWFDSGKLQVAKQGIMSNPLSSAQVADLMKLFSFESSRLEIAKMAFANTIDKQNYYIVNNEFWFSSSVAELDQYLSHL